MLTCVWRERYLWRDLLEVIGSCHSGDLMLKLPLIQPPQAPLLQLWFSALEQDVGDCPNIYSFLLVYFNSDWPHTLFPQKPQLFLSTADVSIHCDSFQANLELSICPPHLSSPEIFDHASQITSLPCVSSPNASHITKGESHSRHIFHRPTWPGSSLRLRHLPPPLLLSNHMCLAPVPPTSSIVLP